MQNYKTLSTGNNEVATLQPEVLQNAVTAITQYQQAGKLTASKAIEGKSLGYYKRIAGTEKLTEMLALFLLKMADRFKLVEDKRINEIDAAEMAKIIIAEHWDLKLAEWALFCEKAGRGEFGTSHEHWRLDIPTIFGWIVTFRTDVLAPAYEAKRASEKPAPPTPDALKKFGDFLKYVKEQNTQTEKEKQAEMDIEKRDHKNRIAKLHRLQTFFPREIDALIALADRYARRYKINYTLQHFLEHDRVQALEDKINSLHEY